MRVRALVWLILSALAAALPAQQQQTEEEILWMPEGYRLLSFEERKALPEGEMKEIGTRNTALLREAAKSMSPEERQDLAARLGQFAQTHDLADFERQYVTMFSMMLLSAGMEEKAQQDRAADQVRFEKLLRDQEETTRGFPSGQGSVEAEAQAVDARRHQDDRVVRYLRILKPLRARPWNRWVRWSFRRVVGADTYAHMGKPTSLYDAAVTFLRAREAEQPEEGSWYSLDAFLRLSYRGEVAEAKRLFAIANAKNARDAECRIFPLLLAEIEEDSAEIARLLPRAQAEWPKPAELEKILFDEISGLPVDLQKKARQTFEAKYKQRHPADWEARVEVLAGRLADKRFREVEDETASLLALPAVSIPEEYRVPFLALHLQAKANLGRCAEAEVTLPEFESRRAQAFPRELDPGAYPRVRTAAEARALRASVDEKQKLQARLQEVFSQDPLKAPELEDVPPAERKDLVEGWLRNVREEIDRARAILNAGDDAAAAAEWSRRELEEWEKEHHIPLDAPGYDIPSRSEGWAIGVRSEMGKCFLEKGNPAAAARVVEPCIGERRNFHTACLDPLVAAGVALASAGRSREAAEIYRLVAPTFIWTDQLYAAIEKTAPGAVRKFQPTPQPTPGASVTPRAEP